MQCHIAGKVDWIVSDGTILHPDLTVVCGPASERHVEETPALVVEVLSASTRERDHKFKKRIYQQQGVVWYLIVDPDADTLQALRLNAEGEYQHIDHVESLSVDICGDCLLDVSLNRLFL